MASELAHNLSSNRKRAFKPKVRTGCFTCKTRRVKCDEEKPSCARCLRTGRKCDGYGPPQPIINAPRTLAPAPAVKSPTEARALELFFHKTANELAGSFEGAFFQGSVAQQSLVEPTIRHAIAAIAILHEQMSLYPAGLELKSHGPNAPIIFYNRAINALLRRFETEQISISLTAMANVLFTCFEYFQGNVAAARTHVKGGIKLLESWRENTRVLRNRPGGQNYDSFESNFMETEIAPLLSVFRVNILGTEDMSGPKVFLNHVDQEGNIVISDRFESIQQARAALLDVIMSKRWHSQSTNKDVASISRPEGTIDSSMKNMNKTVSQWQANFDDLISRQSSTWGKKERQAADVVRIIQLAEMLHGRNYAAGNESSWDSARAEFEEMLSIAESLISDSSRFPEKGFRLLSLDFGKIFCFHLLAWKCRWPSLRRKALSLLRNVSKREWLLDAKHYHAIFSRIMEIEEAHLGLLLDDIFQRDLVAPEYARIFDFTVRPQQSPSSSSSRRSAIYAVTFWSRSLGVDGPPSSVTEYMQLESSHPGETAIPSNLLKQHPSYL